jgi:hypothetical protein
MSSGLGILDYANMLGMHKEPSPRLTQAVSKYRRAESAVARARDEMYAAIIEDLKNDVRQVDVVRATGLTRERIRQIAKAAKNEEAGT